MELTWYEYIPESPPKRWAKWMGLIAVDEKGKIFLPAAFTGKSDMYVLLCAGFDGTPAAKHGKRLWFPAEWIKQEFPSSRELVESALRQISILKSST